LRSPGKTQKENETSGEDWSKKRKRGVLGALEAGARCTHTGEWQPRGKIVGKEMPWSPLAAQCRIVRGPWGNLGSQKKQKKLLQDKYLGRIWTFRGLVAEKACKCDRLRKGWGMISTVLWGWA